MKKIIMMSAGLLICSGIVLANQYGVKSLNFGAPTVKDVDQVADAHDGDIVYQKPDSGPKTPGLWARINGAWIELLSSEASTPAGVISAFGGTTAPAGYLLCNGASYNAVDYPELAQALWDPSTLKYAYGGSGTYPTGTFNVPDLRGQFLRGATSDATKDPNYSSRSAMNSGGNIGASVGSIQAEAYKSHSHYITEGSNGYTGTGGFNNVAQFLNKPGNGGVGGSVYTAADGGSETRPRNAYVNFIIKY
ncbi:MAG: tail fiber protein [Bdellovibrionales bacterium]|nr:tail fiber protein [Bdellovibrionales bacterium]